jgi:hypothetical protein
VHEMARAWVAAPAMSRAEARSILRIPVANILKLISPEPSGVSAN